MRFSDWSSDVCSFDLETASPQSAGGDGLPVVLRRLGDGQPGHEIAVERIWATCFMMKDFHKVVEGEELQIAVRDGENVSARVIWVRSEERSVGKGGVSRCRSRGEP